MTARAAALVLLLLAPAAATAAAVSATVLDAEGKPVAGAVVFVHEAKGAFAPPAEPYVMDQVDKQFVPHLLPVLAGGKVRFPNKDNIHHHIFSFSAAKNFELPLYKGEPAAPVLFDKPGIVKLGCNIHDWMTGVILVLPNPYFAVTGADGKARVEVPEGAELTVFHERLKGAVDATKQKAAPAMTWRLPLRPARPKGASNFDY